MMADAIDSSRPRLYTTYNESTRLDDNNVDMDQEQVDLVRTALEYQYMLNSILIMISAGCRRRLSRFKWRMPFGES